MTLQLLVQICGGALGFLLVWLLLARLIRRIYPFPIPHFLVYLIDNPLRHAVQPPPQTVERLGIRPGMRVLEIGPGSGTYTLAAARAVGSEGSVVALDIAPQIVTRLRERLARESVANVTVQQGDAQHLTFEDGSFDAIFMITVFGELPDPRTALAGFRRVLRPNGTLGLSEFVPDPDYRPAGPVIASCEAEGFELVKQAGNLLHYTLAFNAA